MDDLAALIRQRAERLPYKPPRGEFRSVYEGDEWQWRTDLILAVADLLEEQKKTPLDRVKAWFK